ncbi:DUF4019 domain-containing protein [Variovorax guangxiensis]|uniref:DUF4019 domain-containing protein n=1 Tax=Variovorax guangxiensis TaxID=1775474 RepID=A0A502DIE8_9BURK|nr:DUF4019 domain-containing protein [Variovorax guangxiensis]RZI66574.1 MAG: DUF4019 domain-containing protein [Variovorax sp.]TPG20232.1 DUF4019 domain-containing protein [Variovorax ginsengisoli]TPG23891.1 DUF4019 domain-containing protein [Variovorax guangxiensis]
MTRIAKILLTAACLSGWFGFAAAQDVEPSDMVRGGLQAIQMVDQNKVGELWDGAAVAARKRVTRDEFVKQVAAVRNPMGAPQQRTWVAVNRQVVNDTDPDLGGQYVSVEYESRFANKPTVTVRELVSFHLDRDRVWRFSGYVLR